MQFLRVTAMAAMVLVSWAAPSHAQTGGLDGTYRAPNGYVTGNAACGTTRFGYPIRVQNGTVSLQTASAGLLEGPLGADGSVAFGRGDAQVAGKFTGSHFSGTYAKGRCSFPMELDRGR